MFLKGKREHIVDDSGNLIKKNHQDSVEKIIKPNKKRWLGFFMIVLIALFGLFSWIGLDVWKAAANIITKNLDNPAPFLNLAGKIDPNKLQGEGDGRINILLLGMGGANHPGGQLTDTIEVASIDPVNKKIALLSIPRDLYIKIPGSGYNKINYTYYYGEQNTKTTGGGPTLVKKTISEILDLPIHYYVKLDFTGLVKLVDALGGLDINVDKALSDPFYPAENMIDYDPFYVKVGQQHFDGKTALKYARSRETSSDFDRSRRQQQIMTAVKEKALSSGVLTNPKKLTEIIKILGDHVRTDLKVNEMERVFSIVKNINDTDIISKVIDNSTDGPLVSGQVEGGYYLTPRAGIGNYKDIQTIAHSIFTDPYLAKENAKIEVLNGTGSAGEALEVADLLGSFGYNIYKIDKNEVASPTTVIYDYSNGKFPFTSKFLSDRFQTKISIQPRPKDTASDIKIVLGKDYLLLKKNIISN